ncbi:hypothetical protein COLO4_28938 [Corchorus olitorius]|uniref:Uncharacterized protein n=1 Tax=Corchorus olitorius TaxID=93759 RepID=A0A1R3HHG0_9ROSI|nr:hypothetical protein COLO4_28938 [Corchorus olitorius]
MNHYSYVRGSLFPRHCEDSETRGEAVSVGGSEAVGSAASFEEVISCSKAISCGSTVVFKLSEDVDKEKEESEVANLCGVAALDGVTGDGSN